MKSVLKTAFLLQAIVCVLPAQDQGSGIEIVESVGVYDRKWALVIGINYADAKGVPKLDNAESDAAAISETLARSYGFQCEVLQGKTATAAAIKSRLAKYEREVGPKDCFLFYFAGHGVPRGDLPLLYPVDVEVDGEVANTLPATEVIRDEIKALHSLYIFDSCFSGQIANLNRFPPLNQMRIRQGEPKFESRSIQIFTSSSSNQVANDGANGRSPFSYAIDDGFRHQGQLGSGDRISASALYTHVSEALKNHNQECQLLTLVPDADSSHGGEFVFIGKPPKLPKSRSFVFQTLPGSYVTLPGSALPQTWFDEMPWLTPAMRLLADGEFEADVRSFTSDSKNVETVLFNPDKLAKSLLHSNTWTPEDAAHNLAIRLEGLPKLDDTAYLQLLDEIQVGLKTRNVRPSATDMHTAALLESARIRRKAERPSEEALTDLHQQFIRAQEAYGVEENQGLLARCEADHSLWLLNSCPKNLQGETQAESRCLLIVRNCEHALKIVAGTSGTEPFQIELHSIIAYALRQRAKCLVAETTLNEVQLAKNRRVAVKAWKDAADHYRIAGECAKSAKMQPKDPVFSYLSQRLGWLSMDVWDVGTAKKCFAEATASVPTDATNLVDFINYTSSAQGLAMTKRLSGECAKQDIRVIQNLVLARLKVASPGGPVALLLHERLGNTTERVAECDFLSGKRGLLDASTELRRGMQYCDHWRQSISNQAEEAKVDEQELRFVCKLIVVSALLGDIESSKIFGARFIAIKETGVSVTGFLKVLCEIAEAFNSYALRDAKVNDALTAQEALNAIREAVQLNSGASIEREPAEFLLEVSKAISVLQQRLDSQSRLNLLPRDPSGQLPGEMLKSVRAQYDEVVLLQGRTYSGRVSTADFTKFRELVRSVRQSKCSKEDLFDPFVMYYFSIDGRSGLVLLSYGDNDQQQREGEVYDLGFGWKSVPKLPDQQIAAEIKKLFSEKGDVQSYWSDDQLLNAEGFNSDSPFSSHDESSSVAK